MGLKPPVPAQSGSLPTNNTDSQILGSVGTAPTWLDVDTAVTPADIGAASASGLTAETTARAAADAAITANAQTTNYTLVLGDAGKAVDVSNASARTVTVPPNSSVAFPVGSVVEVTRLGAGTVTLVAGGGVTINSAGGLLALRAQFSGASLRKTATDTWLLTGDLA